MQLVEIIPWELNLPLNQPISIQCSLSIYQQNIKRLGPMVL